MDILANNELLIGLVFAALLCLIVSKVHYFHISRPQNIVVNNTPSISYITLNVGKTGYNVKRSKRRSKHSVRPNGFARRSENAHSTFQPTSKTTAYCGSHNNEWTEKKKHDEENHCGWFTDSGCDESSDVYCKHKEQSESILCIKPFDETNEILTRSENKSTCSLIDDTKRPDYHKQDKSDIVYELETCNSECVKHDELKESNIDCGDRNCRYACEVTSLDYERKYNVENHFDYTDSVDDGSYTVNEQNGPESDLDYTDAVDDGSYTVSDRMPCQDFELGIGSTNSSFQRNTDVLECFQPDSMPLNTTPFANASTTNDVVITSSKSNRAESLRPLIILILQTISILAQVPLLQVILLGVFNPFYSSLLQTMNLKDLNQIKYPILQAMFATIRRSPVMAAMHFRVSIRQFLQTASLNDVNLMLHLQTEFQKDFNPIQYHPRQSLYQVPSTISYIHEIYRPYFITCTRSTVFEICIPDSRPSCSCDVFETFRHHPLMLDTNSSHESMRLDVRPFSTSKAAEKFINDSKPANTSSKHSSACFLPNSKQHTSDASKSFKLQLTTFTQNDLFENVKPDLMLSTSSDEPGYNWLFNPLLFNTSNESESTCLDILSFATSDEEGSYKPDSNLSTSNYTCTNACVLHDSKYYSTVGTSERFQPVPTQFARSEVYRRDTFDALHSTTNFVYSDLQPASSSVASDSFLHDSLSSTSSDETSSMNVSFSSLDSEDSFTLVYPKSTNISIQSGEKNELVCRNLDFQRFEDIQARPITVTHNERESRCVGLETNGDLRTRQQGDDTTYQLNTYQESRYETNPDEPNQERNEGLPSHMTVFQFGYKNSVVECNGLSRHGVDIIDEDSCDGSIKETCTTKCRVLQIYSVKQENVNAVIPSTCVERGATTQRVEFRDIDLGLLRDAVYPVHGRCRSLYIQLGDENVVTLSEYDGKSNRDAMLRHIHAQETQPVGYDTRLETGEYGPARRYYKSYVQAYINRQHSVRTENQT